jgi:hypothetical protein
MSKRVAALQVLRLTLQDHVDYWNRKFAKTPLGVPREAATILDFRGMWLRRHASIRNRAARHARSLIREPNQCLERKFGIKSESPGNLIRLGYGAVGAHVLFEDRDGTRIGPNGTT